jgi:hypothetical protein
MAQFSVKIMRPPGSVLGENQQLQTSVAQTEGKTDIGVDV